MDKPTVLVDCAAGQAMGCSTLCCRLQVMLSVEDLENGLEAQSPLSGLIKQDRDGLCHYLDRDTLRCTVWDKRPLVCRLYNCNNDPKLQVVLREGIDHSYMHLIEASKNIPEEDWLEIPLLASQEPTAEE